jgi:DNA-binding NarL/FixJ family response regulator
METKPDRFKQATSRREFWGFAGVAIWFFSTYLNYNDTLMASGNWVTCFMFALGVSAILSAILFNKRTQALSALALYATPVVVLITAFDHLTPPAMNITLYILSGVLGGPILARRAYGMVRTAQPNKRFIRFMTVVAFGPIFNMVAFFIPETHVWLWYALVAAPLLLGWIGVRRIVPDMPESAMPQANAPKPWRSIIMITITIVLFHLSSMFSSTLHTFLFNIGTNDEFPLITFLAAYLPAFAFILFGWLSDKRWERQGFLVAMALVLVGLFVLLIPGHAYTVPVMSIADGLGGTYYEFFIISFSLYFFTSSKNPMLMAVLGLSIDLFSAGFAWTGITSPETWLLSRADDFDLRYIKELEPVLFAAMGICVALSIVIVLWIQMRNNERALGVVLTERLYGAAGDAASVPAAESEEVALPDTEAFENIGILAVEEQRIATLLIEGYTKGEISRKLKLPTGEVSESLTQIRNKITGRDTSFDTTDADTLLARAATEYKLTTREAQILRGFYEGKSNAEIAAEFFVSESTVKTHINNLFKKLPVKNRTEIREWLLAPGETAGELR